MSAPAESHCSSSSVPSSTSFALPLPSPHPRELHLFPYFQRLAVAHPEQFGHLAVRRSETKGRYLATNKSYQPGELIFEEEAVLTVSDDPTVCLACDGNVRHTTINVACPQFKTHFGTMKTTLAAIESIAKQTGYPVSRIREVMKFVALSYTEVFGYLRGPDAKLSEGERKARSKLWLLLGLDDGSQITEQVTLEGASYTIKPRPTDPDRTMAAQFIHTALPLTYRKHYTPAIIETVMNVLELNAHETAESVIDVTGGASSSNAVDVDGTRGDAVFPFFAMIEHSCHENCCWTTTGHKMRVAALRPITPNNIIKSSKMDFNYQTILVRGLSQSFEKSLQMSPPPIPINVALAEKQHEAYMNLLKSLIPDGRVIEVAGDEKYPDCNFIEDTALLFPDTMVLSRPGALSRLGEIEGVDAVLQTLPFTHRFQITAPATLDGGDVLFTGRHLFIGESKRTNAEATKQLQQYFHQSHLNTPFTVHPLPVTAGLHLKSVISILADGVLVIDESNAAKIIAEQIHLIDPSYEFIRVPDMPSSNVLRIRQTLIIQEGFPRSEPILRAAATKHGLQVASLNMSELIKADGALTCGSLLTTMKSIPESTLTPISINYAPPYLPTSKRRSYLQESYGFQCVCPLCSGELPDLARRFRCTKANCDGAVAPYGEVTSQTIATSRWSCSHCSTIPSSETIQQYLQAEQTIFEVLRRRGDIAAIPEDELFDVLQEEMELVQLVRGEMEQIVETVLANSNSTASTTTIPTTTSSATSTTSSTPVSAPSTASFSVTPNMSKTFRKHSRQLKKAAQAQSRATNSAGSLLQTQTQFLTTAIKSLLTLLSPSHYLIHQLLELLLHLTIPIALAQSSTTASPLWQRAFLYAQTRLTNIRSVCDAHHWSLAREHDRIAMMLIMSGGAVVGEPSDSLASIRTHLQAAYDIHRHLFGPDADSTRRAQARRDTPTPKLQTLI